MSRVNVPRKNDDENEPIEPVKLIAEDMETIIGQYDWDTGDYTAQIYREAPQEYMGRSCGGYCTTVKDKINIEYLQKNFGGKRYKIIIRGPEGKFLKNISNIKIAGDPIIGPGDAHFNQYKGSEQGKGAKSNGDTVAPAQATLNPLVDRIVDRETQRAEDAERRAREFEKRLLLGAQNRNDNSALSLVRESSRDTIEAHRMAVEEANRRSMAAEERMSSLIQTMLSARGGDKQDNSQVYTQMLSAFKEESRSTRDEHIAQLKAVQEQAREQMLVAQEQAREQVKQADSTSKILLENIRMQYESQISTIKEGYSGQIRSLEDQLSRVRDELQTVRNESIRLRDDLQTARHQALEAKISSQNELGNLTNIESSLTKAKSLLSLLGGNSEKSEEASRLDKTLAFLSSGAPERLIGSLATRIGGKNKETTISSYDAPLTPDTQAWSSWRQAQNAPPPQPALIAPQEPTPTKTENPQNLAPQEPPASDETALLRALARKIEDNATKKSAADFADDFIEDAEEQGYVEMITQVSPEALMSAFDAADVELSFQARVYAREVLDLIKKHKSS